MLREAKSGITIPNDVMLVSRDVGERFLLTHAVQVAFLLALLIHILLTRSVLLVVSRAGCIRYLYIIFQSSVAY